MHVTVITPPESIVTLEEVKLHCKIDTSDEDVLVQAYIDAATRWIDGPGGWLGRALGKQTLEISGSFGGREIALPYPPIIGNVSIVTEDAEGNATTVDVSAYRVRDGKVFPSPGAAWVSQPVQRIRYDAGYQKMAGNPPAPIGDVPAAIKVAIYLIVAHWYENREAVASSGSPSQVPMSADTLLSTYRVW